ncbi:MAG: HEAT repeat domain-containing protein [Candidatus Hodarchaeales archaeon]
MSQEKKGEIDPALRKIMNIPDDQELPDDALLEVMLRALESQQLLIRSAAVHQLIDLGKRNPKLALPRILKALDPEVDFWTVRFGAVEALGEIANEVTVKPLEKYLAEDEDLDFRAMVAKQLGEMGEVAKDAGSTLIDSLKNSESTELRENAAHAIGSIKVKEAVNPLINSLKKEKDHYPRREMCWALGELKDSLALPILIEQIEDKDKETRSKAAEALGKLESSSAIVPLIKATKDREVLVQSSAITALKGFSSKSLVSEIERSSEKDVFLALQMFRDYLFNIENEDVAKQVNEIKEPIINAFKEKIKRLIGDLEECKIFVEGTFKKLSKLSKKKLTKLIDTELPKIEGKVANISLYEFRKQKWLEDDLFFEIEEISNLYKETGVMLSELRDNAQKLLKSMEIAKKQPPS